MSYYSVSLGYAMSFGVGLRTSDLVQTIPTLDSPARLARSTTVDTPTSVVARPILQTAKISSHLSKNRSVIF